MPASLHRTGALLLCLTAAAALWPGSVLALTRVDLAAAGACDGASTLDYRMLFAVDGGRPWVSSGRVLAVAGKSEGVPMVAAGEGKDVAAKVLPAADRSGSGRGAEQWMRSADDAPAQPGIWALLAAGFLGICALARPRIFAS
jgi:hypothetical protein